MFPPATGSGLGLNKQEFLHTLSLHYETYTNTLQEGALFKEQGKMKLPTVPCAIGIILTVTLKPYCCYCTCGTQDTSEKRTIAGKRTKNKDGNELRQMGDVCHQTNQVCCIVLLGG